MTHTRKPSFTKSNGNVFEDLQVSAPSDALAKSELAAIIAQALRARRLTQTAAAHLLGIDQPKVSELLRGRLTRFSTERLLVFLLRLGRDVDIVVRGGSSRPGNVTGPHPGAGRDRPPPEGGHRGCGSERTIGHRRPGPIGHALSTRPRGRESGPPPTARHPGRSTTLRHPGRRSGLLDPAAPSLERLG
jgi:predicted XRE-type DNA-binding protein